MCIYLYLYCRWRSNLEISLQNHEFIRDKLSTESQNELQDTTSKTIMRIEPKTVT
jgi:hypothetical protein